MRIDKDMRPCLFRLQDVHKHFNGTKVIGGVSLSIDEGHIVSLIGPNGAGKTTMFNLMSGFLTPDSGALSFKGQDISRMEPFKRARLGIGRTFQEMRLIHRLSALENVWLAMPDQKGESVFDALLGRHKPLESRQRQQAMQWLEYVGIAETWNQLAGELSYGQQKLLSVACCLALGSTLMLLDEPVAGVNPALVEQMLELLQQVRRDQLKTIILIEHNMDAVMKISDRVIGMAQGRVIADGTPQEVREDAALIGAYLG